MHSRNMANVKGEAHRDGDRYVGEFKVGQLNGIGTAYLSSGESLTGQFVDGKKDGEFIVKDRTGKTIKLHIYEKDQLFSWMNI